MNRANLTVPNLLTASRLALVPFVVWYLAQDRLDVAFWLFAAAALTDLLDGNLARLLNQRSVLGAWLDPIADKAMLLSTLMMLVWLEILPLWLGALVALRDVIVLLGAAAFRQLTGGLEVAPTWWGKAATAAEFVLVALALADLALGWGLTFLGYLTLLTGTLVSVSGLHYVWVWSAKTRAWRAAQARFRS
ncbi:CDP-alcohol phosphatidyltransferase family protein [Parasulfuritortus cantonensis]|uniref:CDP-diacylglycerol--glycerol-3-phosphate 3-phosphatidyltransferase n=1 Tax=Parasulfuritortus cantonensis TaxID=2528202 RepID=A0A4R1BGG1_9PROT|nr:CDP-alcohol phosphatidyltransferase family protein [Parasulfuritortus cantonensis]TCJ16281.1 CDP-alcohol phosphatidyltransferase family protein [Parasulfuritortus cantonensis]